MNQHTPIKYGPFSDATGFTDFPVAPSPARARPSLRKQVLQCGILAIFALASYLFIRDYLLQSVQVVGVSMAPTLLNTDRYLLNLCVFHLREPRTGEIVVLRDPLDQSFVVKRIIAREGDSVHVEGGHLYVNGWQLKEPYLPFGVRTFAPNRKQELSWRCGKGEYFVLGDNRENSDDSRVYGAIPRQNILGAIVR